MSHFAHVNKNGIVDQVIVIEADVLASGHWGDPSEWVQTSYNTQRGEHLLGGTPLRKNFAGVGMVYDSVRGAFYSLRPYPSWTLNEGTCTWEPPVPEVPGKGIWDEATLAWRSRNG